MELTTDRIEELISDYQERRLAGENNLASRLKARLESSGVEIEDSREGTRWRRRKENSDE